MFIKATMESFTRNAFSVCPVESAAGLEKFLDIGDHVSRIYPPRLTLPTEATRHVVLNEPPFHLFAESQAWWVEHNGEPVARVMGLVDRVSNEKRAERVGHLLLFESLPGAHRAVQVLFWEALAWLQVRGCDTARLGFRSTIDMPLNIDAYDARPTFLHRGTPPYYHSLVKHAGLCPGPGLIEYHLRFDDSWRERYEAIVDGALRRDIVVKPSHDTAGFTSLLNDCYPEHWGIPYYLPEEIDIWVRDVGQDTPEEFLLFAEVNGELAGATLGCPDFNNPGRGILFEICVRKPFRGLGVNYALGARLFLAMMREGCTEASYTLVLDTNLASRRTAENFGAVPARNFVVYEKAL
jgi:hypothetical protein